jgi:hypothetical protein
MTITYDRPTPRIIVCAVAGGRARVAWISGSTAWPAAGEEQGGSQGGGAAVLRWLVAGGSWCGLAIRQQLGARMHCSSSLHLALPAALPTLLFTYLQK